MRFAIGLKSCLDPLYRSYYNVRHELRRETEDWVCDGVAVGPHNRDHGSYLLWGRRIPHRPPDNRTVAGRLDAMAGDRGIPRGLSSVPCHSRSLGCGH